jgi:GTPase SAR1 family protein
MPTRPVTRVVAWLSRRELYSLAVLGPSAVGKTTLIGLWCGNWSDQKYHPTQAMRQVGTVRLAGDGRRLMLPDLVDVNGRESSRTEWEEPAKDAKAIIYLVNAQHLYGYEMAEGFTEEWVRIEDDADQIGRWIKEKGIGLCIVAVTHRDLDHRYRDLEPEQYHVHIETQLEPIVIRFGGLAKVKIVTGSLDTRENADMLTARILERLR